MISRHLWCAAALLFIALGSTACGSDIESADSSANAETTTTFADEADDSSDNDTSSETDDANATEDTNDTEPVEDGEVSNEQSDPDADSNTDTEANGDAGVTKDDDDTTSAVTDPDDDVDEPVSEDAAAEIASSLAFFGVEEAELDTVSACVIDQGDQEGLTPTDLTEGGGVFLAVLDCAPDTVGEAMRADFADIDTSGLSATPEQIDCTFDATLDFLRGVPLADAASVLDADDAPMAFIDALVDTCGVSVADADFLVNDA